MPLSLFIHNCRRGEEHSFILKPVTSMWKSTKSRGERSMPLPYKNFEGKRSSSITDQYAVLVSCRCNYTGIHTLN